MRLRLHSQFIWFGVSVCVCVQGTTTDMLAVFLKIHLTNVDG